MVSLQNGVSDGGWQCRQGLRVALWVRRPSQHQYNLAIFPNPPLGEDIRHRLGAERTQLPDSATPEDQTPAPLNPWAARKACARRWFYFILFLP